MAEKKIAGRTFRVRPPLATEAIRLQFRVMNLLGGSAAELPAAVEALQSAASAKKEADKVKANGQIVGIVVGILSQMKPDEGTQFVADMVAMAEIKAANGTYEQADIDVEFSEDPTGLFQLVGFVLREVLGPFIQGLVGSMTGQRGAAALVKMKSGG